MTNPVPGAQEAEGRWAPSSVAFPLWLLLLSWAPAVGAAQLLAYVFAPASAIAVLLVRTSRLSRITIVLAAALCGLGALSLALEGDHGRPLNAALAALTYGSLLAFAPRIRFESERYGTFVVAMAWITFVELVVAMGQFVASNASLTFQSMAAGDAAVGTLLTNSHLFAIKMLVSLVVFAVAAILDVRRRIALFGASASLLGVVLSSALMSTVLGAVAIVAVVYLTPTWLVLRHLRRPIGRLRTTVFVAFVAGGLLFFATQPDNVRFTAATLRVLVSPTTGTPERPVPGKVAATLESASLLLSQPKVMLLGTSPGHFSSRAALILSGGYLSPQPSYVPVSLSRYTEAIVLPRWNPSVWSVQYRDGVMNQPFHSVQSIVVELGLLGTLVVLAAYVGLWSRALRFKAWDRGSAAIQLTAVVALVLIPLLLLTDNWLEYPQAAIQLLLPLVLLLNVRRAEAAGVGGPT